MAVFTRKVWFHEISELQERILKKAIIH